MFYIRYCNAICPLRSRVIYVHFQQSKIISSYTSFGTRCYYRNNFLVNLCYIITENNASGDIWDGQYSLKLN